MSSRSVTGWIVGGLAVVALCVHLPPPRINVPFGPEHRAVGERDSTADAPDAIVLDDTLHAGETLSELLARTGLAAPSAAAALEAATSLDERRIPAGMPVTVRTDAGASEPDEVTFQLAVDRLLHVRRTGPTTWSAAEEKLTWTVDTITVRGTINTTLYDALDDGASGDLPRAARAELAWRLADVYEYRIDMSRELQPGDSLRVLVERRRGPGGTVRVGDILAARFATGGTIIDALRFTPASGAVSYFDDDGRSLRTGFLRAPVAFRRISSIFGMRRHPILGIWRQHRGTDYVADAGTPVRAIGDGVVVFRGRRGGYGNCLDIRHHNGFVSRYGHLRAFASGLRVGQSVAMGQTVAYVGMTGLATAPHLHFELLVDGTQRDPARTLSHQDGTPIPVVDRSRFEHQRDVMQTWLGIVPAVAHEQVATN